MCHPKFNSAAGGTESTYLIASEARIEGVEYEHLLLKTKHLPSVSGEASASVTGPLPGVRRPPLRLQSVSSRVTLDTPEPLGAAGSCSRRA